MNIVVNTSPLLFLSHIDRLPVLRSFGQILVPKAVLREIKFKQDDKTQAVEHAVKEWLNVTAVQDENLLAVLTKEIGPGEAAVITVALERKADWAVLDDQDARRYAHRYGLKVIGTMGVLARAKEKGIIASLKQEIENLKLAGFYATDELIAGLLEEVGEG